MVHITRTSSAEMNELLRGLFAKWALDHVTNDCAKTRWCVACKNLFNLLTDEIVKCFLVLHTCTRTDLISFYLFFLSRFSLSSLCLLTMTGGQVKLFGMSFIFIRLFCVSVVLLFMLIVVYHSFFTKVICAFFVNLQLLQFMPITLFVFYYWKTSSIVFLSLSV